MSGGAEASSVTVADPHTAIAASSVSPLIRKIVEDDPHGYVSTSAGIDDDVPDSFKLSGDEYIAQLQIIAQEIEQLKARKPEVSPASAASSSSQTALADWQVELAEQYANRAELYIMQAGLYALGLADITAARVLYPACDRLDELQQSGERSLQNEQTKLARLAANHAALRAYHSALQHTHSGIRVTTVVGGNVANWQMAGDLSALSQGRATDLKAPIDTVVAGTTTASGMQSESDVAGNIHSGDGSLWPLPVVLRSATAGVLCQPSAVAVINDSTSVQSAGILSCSLPRFVVADTGSSRVAIVDPAASDTAAIVRFVAPLVTAAKGSAATPPSSTATASAAVGLKFFQSPEGLCVDDATNTVYVSDTAAHRIVAFSIPPREVASTVSQSASISSVAGGATPLRRSASISVTEFRVIAGTSDVAGFADSDAKGGAALFDHPTGLTLVRDASASASAAYLLCADRANHVIRRIDLPSGRVSTIAGTPRFAGSRDGVAVASSSVSTGGVISTKPIGGAFKPVRTTAVVPVAAPAQFHCPTAIAVSPSTGAIYVADMGGAALRRISTTGVVSTLAIDPTLLRRPSGIALLSAAPPPARAVPIAEDSPVPLSTAPLVSSVPSSDTFPSVISSVSSSSLGASTSVVPSSIASPLLPSASPTPIPAASAVPLSVAAPQTAVGITTASHVGGSKSVSVSSGARASDTVEYLFVSDISLHRVVRFDTRDFSSYEIIGGHHPDSRTGFASSVSFAPVSGQHVDGHQLLAEFSSPFGLCAVNTASAMSGMPAAPLVLVADTHNGAIRSIDAFVTATAVDATADAAAISKAALIAVKASDVRRALASYVKPPKRIPRCDRTSPDPDNADRDDDNYTR